MIPAVYNLIKELRPQLKTPFLEIGSYQVEGQEKYDLRNIFGDSLVGTDMRNGKGVDIVCDITKSLPYRANTVICIDTLEHIFYFFSAIENIKRCLMNDGVAIISVPFAHHIHDYPSDYWRFTPEALRQLFQEHKYVEIIIFGPEINPHHVIGIISNREIVIPDVTELKRQFNRWLLKARIINFMVKIKRTIKPYKN